MDTLLEVSFLKKISINEEILPLYFLNKPSNKRNFINNKRKEKAS